MSRTFSLDEQIAELGHELARRRQVHPVLIERGSMNPNTSALRIGALEAAIQSLTKLKTIRQRDPHIYAIFEIHH